MKILNHSIIILGLSFLLFSCTKMDVVEGDNISRTVKFTYANGNIKIINQKLNLRYNTWISAECVSKEISSFEKCPNDKIDYTKVGKIHIASLKEGSLKTSNNNSQSNNSEVSSTSEDESSSNEEETSNNEEEENYIEPENPPPLPPIECEGGPEVC